MYIAAVVQCALNKVFIRAESGIYFDSLNNNLNEINKISRPDKLRFSTRNLYNSRDALNYTRPVAPPPTAVQYIVIIIALNNVIVRQTGCTFIIRRLAGAGECNNDYTTHIRVSLISPQTAGRTVTVVQNYWPVNRKTNLQLYIYTNHQYTSTVWLRRIKR